MNGVGGMVARGRPGSEGWTGDTGVPMKQGEYIWRAL